MEANTKKIKICFICRSTKSTVYFKFKDYLKKYKFCVNAEFQNDNYELCAKCVMNLQLFNEFKWQCVESEEFWLKLNQMPPEPVSSDILKCEITIEALTVGTSKEDKAIKNNLTTDHVQNNYEENKNNHEKVQSNHVDGNDLMAIKLEPIDTPIEIDFDDYDVDNTDITIENEDADKDYTPKIKKPKLCKEKKANLVQKEGKKNKTVASCDKCNAVFDKKQMLIKHIKTCGKQLEKKKGSPILLKFNKTPKDALYCGLCDVTSKDLSEMHQHLKAHYDENCLKCQLCSFEGKDFGHMLYHRYKHQPEDKKYCYSCCLCDFMTNGLHKSVLKLEYHFRETHLNKKPGICYHCDRVYNKYNTHKIHLELLETGGQACPICSWKFPGKAQVNGHIRSVHGEKVFLCNICGASFHKKLNMEFHMAIHEASDPVKCSHCNKIFKSQKRLDLHMKLVKKGPYFTCAVCSKGYNSRRDFKVHMAYHSDARPFPCPLCDKAFKTKFNADEHMRCVHVKELRFKCDECDMAFPRVEQLKRHKVSHNGLTHPCIYCPKDFNDKGRLNRHVIDKHSSL